MDTATLERINKEIGFAKSYRKDAEEMIAGGKDITDADVIGKVEAAEKALVTVTELRRSAAVSDSLADLAHWQELPESGKTPTVRYERVHSVRVRENDPSRGAEYANAYDFYLRSIARPESYGLDHVHVLDGAKVAERRVLSIQSDSGGGYTIPADVRTEVLRRMPAISRILGLVTTVATGRDAIWWPRVQPNASSGSIYTSAFVGSMVGEIPAATAGQNEPAFGLFEIVLKRARAMALLSMDLVADDEFDIMSFLRDDGATNMALLREQQIIAGSGVGANCTGILNIPSASSPSANQIGTVDVEGSTADTISNTTAAIGTASKLFDLVYAVPKQYRALPTFGVCMTSQSEKKVRKLIDGQGRFIWEPGFGSNVDSLLGYPVVISEFMQDDGTNGNKVFLAADFSQIIVPNRMAVTAQVALERYADQDEVGLFLRQRFGVGVSNTDALRLGIV